MLHTKHLIGTIVVIRPTTLHVASTVGANVFANVDGFDPMYRTCERDYVYDEDDV